MRRLPVFAVVAFCSFLFGTSGATRAADPDPEQILSDSLRVISQAKSLSYSATYRSRVLDQSQVPEQPPGAIFAPTISVEPRELPMKTIQTRAKVVWQRLPDVADDDDPRVRFSIDGTISTVNEVAEDKEKKAPADKAPAGEKQKKPAGKPAEAGAKAAPAGEADGDEILRIAFNGKVLRSLNTKQQAVLEYASDDGELPLAGITRVLPLLDLTSIPEELSRMNRPADTVIQYKGTETIDGTKCYVIEIRIPLEIETTGEPVAEVKDLAYSRRLFVAQSDLLPRRIENQGAQFPGMPTAPEVVRIDLTQMKLNPPVKTGEFELAVPKGFELKEIETEFTSAVMVGDELPEATLTDGDGKERTLTEFHGKLVLLDFWASWCPPCKLSMPGIQEIHDEFKDKGLVVIGVSIDIEEEVDAAKAYLKEKEYNYLTLFDGSDFSEDLGIRSIPHVLLLDTEGKLLYQHTGDSPKLEKRLRKAIEENLKK
ncbi:MAG: redoxin family protein [Planctomycetota bacterium]|nr:redoxin family protein [Planctomycetota bacterium]